MHRKGLLFALLLALLVSLTCCGQLDPAENTQPVHIEEVTDAQDTPQSDETEDADDTAATEDAAEPESEPEDEADLPESGEYTSKNDVARYIYLYGHLPGNFITKKEAKTLGWVSSEGNLGEVAPGKSIGGDRFGNYEGRLAEAPGRTYQECDIDTSGTYRGAKRIVFSNDGLIYYTDDHYQSFTLLYGEE